GTTTKPPSGAMRARATSAPADAMVVPSAATASKGASPAGATRAAARSAPPRPTARIAVRVKGLTQSSPRAGGALFIRTPISAGGKSKSATIPMPRFGEARIAAARTYVTQSSDKSSDRDLQSTARLYTNSTWGLVAHAQNRGA